MNIAIFGGSFNPVHRGHHEIVRQLNLHLTLAKIIIVPAYKNPLKEDLPSIPELIRLSMLVETFSEFKNVEISKYELKKRKTSYTYDTLSHYKHRYPDDQFFLILGEDSFASFHLWAKADSITKLCKIVCFHRSQSKKPAERAASRLQPNDVHWIEASIPDVSATDIRTSRLETVRQNGWLHPKAFEIWEQFRKRKI